MTILQFGRQERGMFATTRWSLVRAAGGQPGSQAQEALAALCDTYWFPLYAYVRRQGCSPVDAEDRVQAFFAFILEGKLFASADPDRGRFRSYLLRSLQNFSRTEHRDAITLKRGGGRLSQALDTHLAEELYSRKSSIHDSPERMFEREWALTLLDSTLRQVREEYAASGQAALCEALEAHLRQDESAVPYAELSVRLQMSEEAVKSAAHRLRKRYRERLRAAVADTLADEREVDDELRLLLQAVG